MLKPFCRRAAFGTLLLSLIGLCHCRAAQAIDLATLNLLTTPLEPALFQPGTPVLDPTIVTPDRISQTGLTPPSLWWIQEQLTNLQWSPDNSNTGCSSDEYSHDLLTYWLAYPGTDGSPRRVDLLVNQQTWGVCNYLQRYTFVTKFGTAAKAFGYNTRVFNTQGELLGAYLCQFAPTAATESDNANAVCGVFLNSQGRGAFSGNAGATPFGAPSPTGAGTR
jgi:hypothetical protein